MLHFKTLRGRIIFFLLGLFILVQCIAFYAVYVVSTRNAQAVIHDELAAGQRIFDQKMKSLSERLSTAARGLSGDFAFKTVFAKRDRPTLFSAMRNQAARIQADVMLIVSLDRLIIADTLHPGARPAKFPFPELIKKAERTGAATAIVFLGDHLYQIAAVPLRAPLTVAWIVVGIRIDDPMAQYFKTLTSLDVTFVGEQDGHAPLVPASSLVAELRQAFPTAFISAHSDLDGTASIVMKGETDLGLSQDLDTQGDVRIAVFLQHSMERALRPYYKLRKILLFLFAGGVFVTTILGVFISSIVTKPVRALVKGARSIQQGDYTQALPVLRQDEIGTCTAAFNLMQEAIAEREERINRQAYYDALTGLPNPSYLHRSLGETISLAREKNQSFALIRMNIERFIEVIATLGHATGNIVLQKFGVLLSDLAPASAVVSRMGGDAFALMVPGEDAEGAVRVVKTIQDRLEEPFWVEKAPIRIEARFGIAAYPVHGDNADTLLMHVDVAEHLARSSPDGFFVYSPERDRHNIRHLTLLGELRRAIDQEELLLYYQPKIHFSSGRIGGVEALIRWKHSQHGFVSPDEFIRLSEGTGLIKPVTLWTLKTALRQCALLNERGINLNMAVNLSMRVLTDQLLPDTIRALLDEFHVPPDQITLEITESAIMMDQERTMDVITRLDSTGARLCVDDFGTGYSSLAYLKNLPMDEVKIDQSFVRKMDTNENDAMIVRSIIDLAHNLRFKVTAEGVETQHIWEMLSAQGCDLSQGWLHGMAMPLEELIAWSETSPWGLGVNS
jgi:diguanylate cyclase (GGDEF)-like protein